MYVATLLRTVSLRSSVPAAREASSQLLSSSYWNSATRACTSCLARDDTCTIHPSSQSWTKVPSLLLCDSSKEHTHQYIYLMIIGAATAGDASPWTASIYKSWYASPWDASIYKITGCHDCYAAIQGSSQKTWSFETVPRERIYQQYLQNYKNKSIF